MRVLSGWLLAIVLGLAVCAARAQTELPEGFADEVVAEGLNAPVALAFAPDGRLFVAEREGAIRVVENGVLREAPFATLDAYTLGECGLLGMTVADDFAETRHVYCFVTVSALSQQIVRLTDVNGVGEDITVIRDQLPTNGSVHNGGCLRFGPDGMLYFSVGDIGESDLSQEMNTFAGKLCRINRDGGVPDDNPFVTPTNTPRAVFALGFRNPFRFCFGPDGMLYLGDVGSTGDDRYEELNRVEAGGNYGWPMFEGPAGDATAIDPILAYHDEGASIAGMTFYTGGNYPEEYQGNLFHLDYVSQVLFRVPFADGEPVSHTPFAQLAGGPVDLAEGPDGSLYYTEIFTGTVRRIRYLLAEAPNSDNNAEPGTGDGSLDLTLDDGTDHQSSGPCGAGSMTATIMMMSLTMTLRVARRTRRSRRMRSDRYRPF